MSANDTFGFGGGGGRGGHKGQTFSATSLKKIRHIMFDTWQNDEKEKAKTASYSSEIFCLVEEIRGY